MEAMAARTPMLAAHKPERVTPRAWERRKHPRFKQRDADRKYNMDSIDVRIITADRRYGAALLDLSVGGVGVLLAAPLQTNLPIGIELQIGQYTVAAFGIVRNVVKTGERYKVGVQFVHLDSPEAELLRLLEMMDARK